MTVVTLLLTTQTVTIVDTTGPTFIYVPADYTAECSDENPMDMAAAVDNCGTVTVTVDEIVIDGCLCWSIHYSKNIYCY